MFPCFDWDYPVRQEKLNKVQACEEVLNLDMLKFGNYGLGVIMAVQQNKKSPSKRGMHRSHDFLVAPQLAVEPTTGETHMRHHISPNGFYRGRKVIKTKNDE